MTPKDIEWATRERESEIDRERKRKRVRERKRKRVRERERDGACVREKRRYFSRWGRCLNLEHCEYCNTSHNASDDSFYKTSECK